MLYKILKYLITICLTFKTPVITVFNVTKKIIPTDRTFDHEFHEDPENATRVEIRHGMTSRILFRSYQYVTREKTLIRILFFFFFCKFRSSKHFLYFAGGFFFCFDTCKFYFNAPHAKAQNSFSIRAYTSDYYRRGGAEEARTK